MYGEGYEEYPLMRKCIGLNNDQNTGHQAHLFFFFFFNLPFTTKLLGKKYSCNIPQLLNMSLVFGHIDFD